MTAPARIALWGTFDVDNYGDHLFPRVAAQEFARRLPGVVVDAFGPFGWLHPTPLDGVRPATPLGLWSGHRTAELAAAYHLVLVGGGELIHLNDAMLAPVYGTSAEEMARLAPSRFFVEGLGPELEAACPVVWHGVGVPWTPVGEAAQRVRTALAGRAYVTVRDHHSADRLRAAGVERSVDVVPDSALLLDRVLPAERLAARREALRAAGCYPPAGPAGDPLVLQGCDLLAPHVAGVAAAVRGWRAARPVPPPVVVLETGRCRGDLATADLLEEALSGERVWRLPPAAGVEDIAAALAGGSTFAGTSLHGAVTAFVFGRPFLLLNLIGDAKLDGFGHLVGLPDRVLHTAPAIPAALDQARAETPPPGLLAGLAARIDRHFDRLAGMATERATARGPARARGTLRLAAPARALYGRLLPARFR